MTKLGKKILFIASFLFFVIFLVGCDDEKKTYALNLPNEISASLDNLTNIQDGTEVMLTVAVPQGKIIDKLVVNGEEVVVTNNTYKLKITKNTTVTVTFKDPEPEPVYYKLTLPGGVTANVSDLNNVLENTEIILTVAVPAEKEIAELTVNGVKVSVAENKHSFTMTSDTIVTISFKDPKPPIANYKLTLPADVTANVSDLNQIAENSEVTLTINVPAGKLLDYLKVNGQTVTVTGNTYLFVISKDTDVEVAFKDPAPTDEFVKLTLPSGVTANVANLDEVLKGSDVTLTINVPSGKLLDSLVVDGHQVAVIGNTYTFTILKDVTVSVSFKDPAPTDVFFKLTLPSGVTANVTNLDEILEGTAITLAIAAPTDYRLDYLKVNAELVNVVNNSYTFTITQDTIVEVEFKYDDGWEEALFSEVVEFLNQLSGEFFQPGTLGFELNLNADEIKMFAEALILFDQDLNVVEAVINYDSFYEEELQERLGIYNDGLYLYYLEEAFGEDIEDGEESMVMVLNINAQLLETIVPLALMTFLEEEISFLPGGPHSINEFLNLVIGLGSGFITEDLELLMLFEFSKKDDFLKLALNIDNAKIMELSQEFGEAFAEFEFDELDNSEIEINFEVIFTNYKFKSIGLNVSIETEENYLSIGGFLGYSEKAIKAPFELNQFDVSELESITYYFHLGEDKIEEFIVQKDFVENLLEEIDDPEIIEMMISYLSPYQKGYYPIGFYLDVDFTTPLSGDDLLTDNLAVYVEWEEDLTYEELLALLIEDGVLYLSYDDYENMTYYEDDTVIVYYYEYGNFIYWRKDTNIAYSVEMNGGLQLYQLAADFPLFSPLLGILSEADESALLEYRGAYFNLDAGFVLTKERVVLLLDDEYFYPAFYLKGELDEVVLNTLVYLDAAVNEAVFDEIEEVYISDYAKIQDINTMEEKITYRIYYTSGISKLVTLGEMKALGQIDYILPSEANDYTFTLITEDGEEIIDYFLFYDSNRGLFAYFEDIEELYYVAELEELPSLKEANSYQTLIGWRLSEQTIFSTIEKLKDYQTTEKIIYLEAENEMLEFADILNVMKSNRYLMLRFQRDSNEFVCFDFINEEFIIFKLSHFSFFKITDDFISHQNSSHYISVPKEAFNQDSFIYDLFGEYFSASTGVNDMMLRRLLQLHEVLTTDLTYTIEKNKITFSNDLEFTIYNDMLLFDLGWGIYEVSSQDEEVSAFKVEDYPFTYEILSDVAGKIIVKLQSYHYFNIQQFYNFENYLFEQFYFVDENQDPDFENPLESVYDVGTEVEEITLFAKYFKLESPLYYLSELTANDRFILEGENITIYVDKEALIEIHQDSELKYIIDVVNNTSYIYDGLVLYEYLEGNIFNLVSFLENLTDEMFYLMDRNYFYFGPEIEDLYFFRIGIDNDITTIEMTIGSLGFFSKEYEVQLADFEPVVLEDFDIELEMITEVLVKSYRDQFLENELSNELWIEIIFSSGRNLYLDYDKLLNQYDAEIIIEKEESWLSLTIGDETINFTLSEHNIKIFGFNYGLVLFFEDLNRHHYLVDLDEFPVIDKYYVADTKWTFNFNLITIDELRRDYSDWDYLYLNPVYQCRNGIEILDYLDNVVSLESFAFTGFPEEAIYHIAEETFVVSDTVIKFDGDFVIVYTEDDYLKYNYKYYQVQQTGLTFMGIYSYEAFLRAALDIREYLKGNLELDFEEHQKTHFNDGSMLVVNPGSDYTTYEKSGVKINIFELSTPEDYTIPEPATEFEYQLTTTNTWTLNDLEEFEIQFNFGWPDTFLSATFSLHGYTFMGYYFTDETGYPTEQSLYFDYDTSRELTVFAYYKEP